MTRNPRQPSRVLASTNTLNTRRRIGASDSHEAPSLPPIASRPTYRDPFSPYYSANTIANSLSFPAHLWMTEQGQIEDQSLFQAYSNFVNPPKKRVSPPSPVDFTIPEQDPPDGEALLQVLGGLPRPIPTKIPKASPPIPPSMLTPKEQDLRSKVVNQGVGEYNAPTTRGTKRGRSDEDGEVQSKSAKRSKVESKLRECIVCFSELDPERFPEIQHEPAQEHISSVCSDCWQAHLSSEIEIKRWNDIHCPQCSQTLHEREIKEMAEEEVYGRWLDKAAKACQESDEEFRSCPSAACSWGCFFSTREDGNIFICQMCSYRYCVMCEIPMHEGQTCKQYQKAQKEQKDRAKAAKRQAKEEKASDKKVNSISKPCPGCKSRLDKYTGCDHVTCTQCRHEFCWRCLAPYAGPNGIRVRGNAAHQQTCSYSSHRLPNVPAAYRNN